MHQLISKIQYRNFEAGEFVYAIDRTYEQTISLIENFPWQEQRKKIEISLTAPSITIEGPNNDFLKVALYFNGKYVIYFLDNHKKLFGKSFNNINETYPFVKVFFEGISFDTSKLKKESTWMQDNLKHFVTNNFVYDFYKKPILEKMPFFMEGVSVLFIFIVLQSIYGFNLRSIFFSLIITIFFLVIFNGRSLIHYLYYYKFAKEHILIISKASDNFYFGTRGQPELDQKKDIHECTTIKLHHRSSHFSITELELTDGQILKIPNHIINSSDLEFKLEECAIRTTVRWSYLKK